MLDLGVREIPLIRFFGVIQEEMVIVHADLEGCFPKSKTVPGTSSSHHFPQYLATKLLINSQVRIESFFNLISTNH